MNPWTKKRLLDVIRIAVTVAALWLVVQGVTVRDRVTLKTGDTVTGLVGADGTIADTEWLVIETPDGEVKRIPRADVALDKDGALSISYGLITAWRASAKTLLLVALAIHALVIFPQALRFQLLLSAQDIRMGYWEALKLSFAGNFLNFATPLGSNMGDVFKAYFVALHTEHKAEAVATVAVDRMVGLATLVIVVSAITAFGPAGSRLAELRPYALGIFGGGVIVMFVYLSPTIRGRLKTPAWLKRFRAFELIRRADVAVRGLTRHKAILLGAFLLTVLLQWLALGAYFTVTVALGLDARVGNVVEYYAYFYCGALVQAFPGPPQGLGTVELAYRYLLAPFGSPSQIVCAAFAIRLVVLACALPGMVVTLTGSYRPRVLAEPGLGRESTVNTT